MNKPAFHLKAWDEYQYWQNQDRKTLHRINELIKDDERNRETGALKIWRGL